MRVPPSSTIPPRPALLSLALSALAALALGCSSSSASAGASTADGGGDDAATDTGSATGTEAGMDAEPDAPASSDLCDGSIALPTDGSSGTECGQCLEAHCAASLAMCQLDCMCASSTECLAVHNDNYTLCPVALSAIGAGNPGLTLVASCIAMSCISACNGTD